MRLFQSLPTVDELCIRRILHLLYGPDRCSESSQAAWDKANELLLLCDRLAAAEAV